MDAISMFRDMPGFKQWQGELFQCLPPARVMLWLRRYPYGTTIDGMLPWMGLGRGTKAKRQLDGMLRQLEQQKLAKVVRAGHAEEVRLWASTLVTEAAVLPPQHGEFP